MKRRSLGAARLTRAAALAALTALAFEACSTTEDSTVLAPAGPANIDIAGKTVLQCAKTIAITLTVSNWNLRPPGDCGTTPQCGSVRVSLIAPDGTIIKERQTTGLGVVLDFTDTTADAFTQVWSQMPSPTVRAELIDDAGRPFVVADGGQGFVEQPLSLMLKQGTCAGELGAAGAGGASPGGAGAPGTSSGEGGMAGALGTGGGAGAAPEGGAGGAPIVSAGAPAI